MKQAAQLLQATIAEHIEVMEALANEQPHLLRIAKEMSQAILRGNKILWMGNGGSAADSQHLAAEVVGRFQRERRGLASISLAANPSILTAVGNDFGYDHVFRRQIEALCRPGDVVVGISTSGNSKNVCLALKAAQTAGAYTLAFTGQHGGQLANIAQDSLRIPSNVTARIQEGYMLCGHFLCDCIESSVHEGSDSATELGAGGTIGAFDKTS
jgi:D-sedoheptulose 7-phosphate isomerase